MQNKPPRAGLRGTAEKGRNSFLNRNNYSALPASQQVSGLHPIGPTAAEVVADFWFRRTVERVHNLGPRVTAELLGELGAERGIRTIIDKKLRRYAALDPKTLEATGGSDFWPAPIHEVQP